MVYIIYIYDYHYNKEKLNIDFLYDINCYLLNSCFKCDKFYAHCQPNATLLRYLGGAWGRQ